MVHGTGVLLRIQNLHLLVSAAHVFDDFDKLLIPVNNGKFMFHPGGEIIINSPKTFREDDNLDIGVLILDLESINELKSTYKFLEHEQISINHVFDETQDYMIFGFPSTWSNRSATRKSFHIRPFYNFANPVNNSEYEKFNRKHYLNIIVEYNRKYAINAKSKSLSYGPNLHGMSGCGLWNLSSFPKVKLVGIMTDWPIKNRKRIIGIRMDIITETLRKHSNLDIEESKLFGLK